MTILVVFCRFVRTINIIMCVLVHTLYSERYETVLQVTNTSSLFVVHCVRVESDCDLRAFTRVTTMAAR